MAQQIGIMKNFRMKNMAHQRIIFWLLPR